MRNIEISKIVEFADKGTPGPTSADPSARLARIAFVSHAAAIRTIGLEEELEGSPADIIAAVTDLRNRFSAFPRRQRPDSSRGSLNENNGLLPFDTFLLGQKERHQERTDIKLGTIPDSLWARAYNLIAASHSHEKLSKSGIDPADFNTVFVPDGKGQEMYIVETGWPNRSRWSLDHVNDEWGETYVENATRFMFEGSEVDALSGMTEDVWNALLDEETEGHNLHPYVAFKTPSSKLPNAADLSSGDIRYLPATRLTGEPGDSQDSYSYPYAFLSPDGDRVVVRTLDDRIAVRKKFAKFFIDDRYRRAVLVGRIPE